MNKEESKIKFPKGYMKKCRGIYNNLGMNRRMQFRTNQVDSSLSSEITSRGKQNNK